EVAAAEPGDERVHADPALAAPPVPALEQGADLRARRDLPVGRHRVLEVVDEAVGGQPEGLGHHLFVAAGDEVERPAQPLGHPASCLRIMAARRVRMTSSPCWFRARCSNVMIPPWARYFASPLSTP